jgi:CNT family concentrative nucleoside transporter
MSPASGQVASGRVVELTQPSVLAVDNGEGRAHGDVRAEARAPSNSASPERPSDHEQVGSELSETPDQMELPPPETDNIVQAAAEGAINAVPLVACIAASLIAFIALVAMLDALVQWMGSLVGVNDLTFTRILGWLGWPIAFLMGVPPADCAFVGELIGIKTASNEFVAYARLAAAIDEGRVGGRAIVIASYALCGFSNLGSMGIMVGGLSQMAPKKRALLSQEVVRALVAGTLACFATACVAGALYGEDEPSDAASRGEDAAAVC